MLKRIATTALIAFSLQSCTTLEVVHADLSLPCIPKHGVTFEDGETDVMSDELFDKFEKIIITYKQRILTQCILAEQHNKEHAK